VIYIFFIIPIFRFGLYFWDVSKVSKDVYDDISDNYKSTAQYSGLSEDAKNNFAGINWAVSMFGQRKLEDNIVGVARGLESANEAMILINKYDLSKYITSDEKVPESSITQIQNILLLLNSAKGQLDAVENLNFPFGSSDTILKIRNWSYETHKKLLEKTKVQN